MKSILAEEFYVPSNFLQNIRDNKVKSLYSEPDLR